jgi:hypothetical protein
LLLIETPNTDGYDRALFTAGTWGGYYVPRHLNLYNFKRLRHLIEGTGLSVVRQRSLPAPVVWCYSFKAVVAERLGGPKFAAAFFDLRNLPLLAAFAALDALAAKLGLTTSNQQIVALKAGD